MKNYSQYAEQQHILEYFRTSVSQKSFLDIGACDGVTFSNTAALAASGWCGTCVEASRHNVRLLQANYANDPKIKIVGQPIAWSDAPVDFIESVRDPIHQHECRLLGSTQKNHASKWSSCGVTFAPPEQRPGITIDSLLLKYPGPYDFISIDTEGTSVDILMQIPLARLKTRLICVEHDGRQADCLAYCKAAGVGRVIYHNNVNILIGR